MEVIINDEETKEEYLNVKKPYLNIKYSSAIDDFILYDKYRFQIGTSKNYQK